MGYLLSALGLLTSSQSLESLVPSSPHGSAGAFSVTLATDAVHGVLVVGVLWLRLRIHVQLLVLNYIIAGEFFVCMHIFAFVITLTDLIAVVLVFLLHSVILADMGVFKWVLHVIGPTAKAKCSLIIRVYFTTIL